MSLTTRSASRLIPLCSVGTALAVGIYANLLTNQLNSSRTNGKSMPLGNAVANLHWWNLLLATIVLLIIFQYRLATISERRLRHMADDLITDILQAACKAFVFTRANRHIRAIVTLRQGQTGRRVTKYNWNADPDPERIASFDLNFGVTGEAYQTRSTVARELTPDHHTGYDERTQQAVLPELRSILASVVLQSESEEDEPLGVLAFDSTNTLHELGWDRESARDVSRRWADLVAMLLCAKEGREWPSR